MGWVAKEGRRTPNSEVVERKYRSSVGAVYSSSLSNRESSKYPLIGVRMGKSYGHGRRSVYDIIGGVA